MQRKGKKVSQSAQRITKGRLVTRNQTVIPDTHLHAHPDQRKIAEGPDLDHGLDQEVLEQVLHTPDQTELEVTEDRALKGPTIMNQTGDRTGVLHAGIEDVLALGLTELGTVPTLKMTTEKQGRGQVTTVGHLTTQARIRSQNHHPTQNLKKPQNL